MNTDKNKVLYYTPSTQRVKSHWVSQHINQGRLVGPVWRDGNSNSGVMSFAGYTRKNPKR